MKTFPKPLTAREERECLDRYQKGDQEARATLIERNMRLVAHVAKKYQNTDYDMEDILSVGTIGLIKAVNTFHPDRGSRLATYAAKCVENGILSQRPAARTYMPGKHGQGFRSLADYIHGLGLKFGIHIMRGILRAAAHNHTKILGTGKKANEIAYPSSICFWNPDMYGLIPGEERAREYYDSIMDLYARIEEAWHYEKLRQL